MKRMFQICNRKSQKVCCGCPCLTKQQCPHVLDLYEVRDVTRLKALICNKQERTFFCCSNIEEEQVEDKIKIDNIPDDPKSNPAWLPDPGNLFM